jgi:hypothetical protein
MSTTHTPLKVIMTESSENAYGSRFASQETQRSNDKYPSLVIPGYIYSAKGEPLTVILHV